MMSKNKTYYLLGFLFLFFSFYSAHELRNNYEGNFYYFLIVILTCISTDIGGYIFGKIFKGPKLSKISPKKTFSGMIGGYFLSIIFLNIFLTSPLLFLESSQITTDIFIFILLVSSVSQIGDLIISYFKRLSKIKDTGRIIPGHGGLLDRIDGMIFAFPFSYLILDINILKYI